MMEPAEFIIKILIIATLCAGILGMILESSQFEGIVIANNQDRLSLDLVHAISAAPCLTESVSGERRKGLLLESKLNEYTEIPCINVKAEWNVKITDGEHEWIFGKPVGDFASKRTLPVAIKRIDGEVVPGKIIVKLRR